MYVCVLSHFSFVFLCVTLWTVAWQVPLSMGFSRQEYWSGLPCLSLGDLPDPGIKPMSLMSPPLAGRFLPLVPPGKPMHVYTHTKRYMTTLNCLWYVCVCLVTQLGPTLCNPMDCSPPGSFVHGDSLSKNIGVGCHALLQGIFPTQDRSQVSCTADGFFTIWAAREACLWYGPIWKYLVMYLVSLF